MVQWSLLSFEQFDAVLTMVCCIKAIQIVSIFVIDTASTPKTQSQRGSKRQPKYSEFMNCLFRPCVCYRCSYLDHTPTSVLLTLDLKGYEKIKGLLQALAVTGPVALLSAVKRWLNSGNGNSWEAHVKPFQKQLRTHGAFSHIVIFPSASTATCIRSLVLVH